MHSLLKKLSSRAEKSPPVTYQYQALKSRYEIRLLKLQPALIDGCLALTIELFNRALPDQPTFHALSYCWGNPVPTRKIYLNSYVHYVHENLWILLQRLWQKGMFEYFWTDCLSLNQRNDDELGQQVPAMKHIYSGAKNVFMFLGSATQEDRALVDMHCWDGKESPMKPFEAARTLLTFPFWQRVWIIQEVVLASHGTLLAGTASMPLDAFLTKLLPLLESSELSSLPAVPSIKRIHYYRTKHRPRIALFRLLKDFQQTQCTQPADRVYGLLSLVPYPIDLANRLDLRKGKPASNVFWDVVLECSFPVFSLENIVTVLGPMYSESYPAAYLTSLERYALDATTSSTHRAQADMVLSVVRAAHVLMKKFVPLDLYSSQPVEWVRVFGRIISRGPVILANPEFTEFGYFERFHWFFRVGIELARFTAPTCGCIIADAAPSSGMGEWKERSGFWDLKWSVVQDWFKLEYRGSDDSLFAQRLDPCRRDGGEAGFVFEFIGGRMGLCMSGSDGYGTLCCELFKEE